MANPSQQKQTVRAHHQGAKRKLNLRRLVVPLDFTLQSRLALRHAVPLARQHGAKISLVHVVPPVTVMASLPGDATSYMPINNNAELLKSTRRQLKELGDQLLPKELLGRHFVCEGNAAYEVVRVAESIRADLIVLSTHSRSNLERVVFGSTAEKIVRHAHCPVLAVRRPGQDESAPPEENEANYPSRFPCRQILVPLDFSLTSLRALEMAGPLAEECGASMLLLLHVVEPNPYAAGMDGSVLTVTPVPEQQDCASHLARIGEHFVPSSVPYASLVLRGRPASVIVEAAAQKKADLIVLSTHGHTGLERLLLGSTAEQVLRHATTSVLVVRQQTHRQ